MRGIGNNTDSTSFLCLYVKYKTTSRRLNVEKGGKNMKHSYSTKQRLLSNMIACVLSLVRKSAAYLDKYCLKKTCCSIVRKWYDRTIHPPCYLIPIIRGLGVMALFLSVMKQHSLSALLRIVTYLLRRIGITTKCIPAPQTTLDWVIECMIGFRGILCVLLLTGIPIPTVTITAIGIVILSLQGYKHCTQ